MNSELTNIQHPNRKKIEWLGFYLVLAAIIIFGLYQFADHIKTRTLPAGYINIKVLQSKYLVGEPVQVKLNNNFSTTIYVGNECPEEPLAVYRQEEGKWVRIRQKADVESCKSQDREIGIKANSYAIVDFSPWKKMFMKPGMYRIVALVEHYNSLPYEDFEVVAPPTNPVPTQVQLNPDGHTETPSPEDQPTQRRERENNQADD